MPHSAPPEQRSAAHEPDTPSILIPLPGNALSSADSKMALFSYENLAQLPPGPIFHLVERLSTLTLCRALLLADKPARDLFSSCMPASATEYAQVLFSREAPYTRPPEHFVAAAKLMAILRQHALEQNSAFLAGTAWHAQAESAMLAASTHDGKLEQARSTPRI